jgi:hypothetical protein
MPLPAWPPALRACPRTPTDKAFATLTLASRGALAERGTAPSALVRKLRLPR